MSDDATLMVLWHNYFKEVIYQSLFQFVSGSWDKMLKLWSAGRSVSMFDVTSKYMYCHFLYLSAYAHFPTMSEDKPLCRDFEIILKRLIYLFQD